MEDLSGGAEAYPVPLYSRQAAGEPSSEPSRPEFAYAARSLNRTLITTEGAMLPELLSRTAAQGQLCRAEQGRHRSLLRVHTSDPWSPWQGRRQDHLLSEAGGEKRPRHR